MHRYLAFTWDDADLEQAATVRRLIQRLDYTWTSVLDRPGLAVWLAGAQSPTSQVYVLNQKHGVILGKLFLRTGEDRSTSAATDLGHHASQLIVGSRGRVLAQHYWGRYVAFLQDHRTTCVLRDPTGGIPCFATQHERVTVYFCELEDCNALGIMPGAVNWQYIKAALCYAGGLYARETGLTEVTQVLGGECVELHEGRTTRAFYWEPRAFACEGLIEDPAEATARTRACTLDVVHAWAAGHQNVLHALGGLDSSIVLACLASAPSAPTITCYNYYSEGSNSDERYYARLAAQKIQCKLIEWPRDPSLRLDTILRMRRHPIPENYLSVVEAAEVEPRLAEQCGATAITTGVGGDQLWCQNHAMGAIDYAVRHGVALSLFRIAMESARMDSASVWRTLRESIAHRFSFRASNVGAIFEQSARRVLVTDAVIEALRSGDGYTHPLVSEYSKPSPRERIGLGKLLQFAQLLRPAVTQSLLTPYDTPPYVSPLLSQPLIELCLRIPTYIHTHGGWDRAIARLAFQHDLPRQVVSRRTKGGWEEQARDLFKGNVEFIRRWVADGELVRQGVLDQRGLSDLFAGRPTRRAATPVELYDCLFTETWLRHYASWPTRAQEGANIAMQQSQPARV